MNIPKLPDDTLLNPAQHLEYRSVTGCIGYMAQSFQPDLCSDASFLARRSGSPTVKDAKEANNILNFSKENQVVLTFRSGAYQLLVYSDAGNLDKVREGKAQGGRLYILVDQTGHVIESFVHWESRTI